MTARGARYLYLILDLPEAARGSEVTADDMERYGARLCEYRVQELEPVPPGPNE